MNSNSLTIADALKALQQNIQAEHTLIASRVTWYVTSQAFLLSAYATSWNAGFQRPLFFHSVLPIAAIMLSVVIFASIYAATWAQDAYLREQAALVARLKNEVTMSPAELIALATYERTMVSNRTSAHGKAIGGLIHAIGRITPLVLPVGFSAVWLYAYHFAPLFAG
jgi:hypothetical protein